MRLLILTQKVDEDDPILGFFHGWLKEFSKHFEKITVICLEKGKYNLPSNVRVLSLGKELGTSKLKKLFTFYFLLFTLRKQYDSVFIHMNQEYVILGWKFWKLFGKKIYMWRNHSSGNFLTRLAIFFCDKVFCTSSESFTAKFKKSEIMPVGVDTRVFKPNESIERKQNSILFLGRIAPIKKPNIFIEALKLLHQRGDNFSASIYGNPMPEHKNFYLNLQRTVQNSGLNGKVSFYPAVPNYETPGIYASYDIFVNLSPDGLYDKTMFEAMSSGALLISPHSNLRKEIDPELILKVGNAENLAQSLHRLLHLDSQKRFTMRNELRSYVESNHDLSILARQLKKSLRT